MKNKRRLIPIIAAVHFALIAVLNLLLVGIVSGELSVNSEPNLLKEPITSLIYMLLLPIFTPLHPEIFGWLSIGLLVVNSFLWAIALYGIAALLLKIKNRGKRPKPAALSFF